MTARAQAANIILLHENEKDIYGDTIARCVDLLQSCDNAHMQVVFDPANIIQCGQIPYPDAYQALHPWLRYMHVKDAHADGFFSLEPHLAAAGRYAGFSGPDLFRRASQALQRMLMAMGWEYA
jgi:3-dehydroshikimate dehydratase